MAAQANESSPPALDEGAASPPTGVLGAQPGAGGAAPQADEADGLALLAAQGPPVAEDWDPDRFEFVALLQEAPRNNGRVELCLDKRTDRQVAVKVMPLSWVCESEEAFRESHPEENELPWRDIRATCHLSQSAGLACVCEFVGLFRSDGTEHGQEMRMVTSYCEGGDLFMWLERSLSVTGAARETLARPLMRRVLQAVREVHARGFSHGDLSLENVMLATTDPNPESAVIKLIDFGACAGRHVSGVRGKPSYQAPEAHQPGHYDARAADAFSVGVMLFTLAVGNYPWRSTRPHVCPCWKFAANAGLDAYLTRRKINGKSGQAISLKELLSPELVAVLDGLLLVDASARLDISSALEMPWFSDSGGASSSSGG